MSIARFGGKIAVVTGAAQGIGRATALRLAGEGAHVVVADISDDAVRAVAREIGGSASVQVGDLSTASGVRELMAGVLERWGRIDVLVNNVGGARRAARLEQFTEAEIEREIAVSLWPTLWGCHAVLPCMLDQGLGSIVNVASTSPRGILRAPYAAAKGGVIALTTALALETARRGVRVNCVAPGATQVTDRATPRDLFAGEAGEQLRAFFEHQIPMGRWGTVDEQAAAIAFLASEEASFITGQILTVGGGATVP